MSICSRQAASFFRKKESNSSSPGLLAQFSVCGSQGSMKMESMPVNVAIVNSPAGIGTTKAPPRCLKRP